MMRKGKLIEARRIGRLTALAVLGLFLLSSGLGAQALDYTLRETIPIPSGIIGVVHFGDMDGGGVLDIVLMNHSTRRILALECSGATFVTRFSYNTGEFFTGGRVADVDGDGVPEIASKTSFSALFRVHEASRDNTYALRLSRHLGRFLESVVDRDSG